MGLLVGLAAVGIDFSGLTDRYPNTAAAHALLSWAEETAGATVQNQIAEITCVSWSRSGDLWVVV